MSAPIVSVFREIFKENAKFASRISTLLEQYEQLAAKSGHELDGLLTPKAKKKEKDRRWGTQKAINFVHVIL